MEIQLRKFDMTEIKDDKVKSIEKSSILLKLDEPREKTLNKVDEIYSTQFKNSESFSIMMAMSLNELNNSDDPLILFQNMIKRQKILIDKINQGDNSIDPRCFLILDDCLYDNTWAKDKWMRSVFMNGRHYKMLFLLTMQYALGVPPNLRTNVDYVFILRENYVSNRKRLYEHYAGMFPTFEMFCQVMDQCTENYECLVINNNAKSNKLTDQVFWYKAEPHDDFKIGAPSFWEYSEKNILKEGENEQLNSGYKNKVLVKKNELY